MRTLLRSSALGILVISSACGDDEPPASNNISQPDGGSSSGDGAPPSSDASNDGSDGSTATPFIPVYRDINHVLSTGQSLSVGAVGSPALTTTQPYANITFVTGVMSGGTGLTSFIPLVEGDTIPGSNSVVETMSSSFANLVTKIAREEVLVGQPAGQTSHDLLLSVHGIGGTAYVGLKKGTAAYTTGMAQAQAGHDLAVAAGKTHIVRAVTNVHGESDAIANNTAYEANLVEWQSNYETDAKAITGQTESIPMLHSQFSSWTRLGAKPTTSIIPAAQLAAHVNSAGKIILVGAKYHLPYVADGVHLTNEGYRHMGEDYAKVYRRVILEGKPWEPVRPSSITRVDAVVTVKMHVPAPPLVLDTTLVTNPGGFGFEWTDDGPATPTIASVAIADPETVTVTLSATPTGANKRLRYAHTGASNALGGPTTGPRGNLRDSDATPSRNGYALYNWCVHFDLPAP